MSPLLLHSNTNQYNKWFALYITPRCFAYIHAATTFYQLQRGFGAGGNMRGSRNFCQFYLILSLFYSLQRGSNSFIAEKTVLILYQESREVPLFPGGGCPTFFRGVQMLISIEIHIRTCYFPGGGGVPDPLSPSGSAHGQCHHNGTIYITVPLLTMIAGMLCQD